MNKTLNKLIVFLACIVIASSCNNSRGISVTKRHYSKGNYVSVNKKQKNFVNHEGAKKLLPNIPAKQEIVANSQEPIHEDRSIEANGEQKLGNSSTIQNSNRLNDMMLAAEGDKIKQVAPIESIKGLSKINKVNNLFHLNKIQPNGEARSLFWLVITILLIIWLVALVSGGWGLGGLVNLLLLIALILFILWLLRLI